MAKDLEENPPGSHLKINTHQEGGKFNSISRTRDLKKRVKCNESLLPQTAARWEAGPQGGDGGEADSSAAFGLNIAPCLEGMIPAHLSGDKFVIYLALA